MNGKLLKVGLFLGGSSSEKEISLETGRHIYNSLDQTKYEIIPLFVDNANHIWKIDEGLLWMNTCSDVEAQLSASATRVYYEEISKLIDYAFLALHGKYGEECLPGLLELFAIPNNSSGVLGGSLGMDKVFQKMILEANGLTVAKYLSLTINEWADHPFPPEAGHHSSTKEGIIRKVEKELGYSFIVKPSREGCSVAISKVNKKEEVEKAFAEAFKFDNTILLEQFLKGREVTTTIIDEDNISRALMPTETPYKGDFLSVQEKFLPGDATMITPPDLPQEEIETIRAEALKAYQVLRQKNCSRIDGIWSNGKLYILEPNSPPGMTPSTMVWHQAAEEGWSASEFLDKAIGNRNS